ncbi:succinylarginine dihydrolase, partial [Candidatus Marinamargulisbacteria bacterium SCGC AG-439-L15]
MSYQTVNISGLSGPTHHFGGLSYGNTASMTHKHHISNPKKAAIDCLEKMKQLLDLGVPQILMPPQECPKVAPITALGYQGSQKKLSENIITAHPHLLTELYSSSNMWTANSASISPSLDTQDHRVHITPANLSASRHRALELPHTSKMLTLIFDNPNYFVHHPPLPHYYQDEGAANQLRLCHPQTKQGIRLFVYGKNIDKQSAFPARHSYEACYGIANSHTLDPRRTLFLEQNKQAIQKGVFHNDVISLSYQNTLLYHEDTFEDSNSIEHIQKKSIEHGWELNC